MRPSNAAQEVIPEVLSMNPVEEKSISKIFPDANVIDEAVAISFLVFIYF